MCVVFTMTQTFAISGGPPYPGSTNVVGVFAGVMKPKKTPATCPADPSTCPDSPSGCSANTLGVFSIGVPNSGLSTGTFVMFSQGRVFSGNIQGVADPGKATLKAVLNATFNFTVTFPSPSPSRTVAVTASATGNLNTKITTVSSQTARGAASTRLIGSATMELSQGQVDAALQPVPTCAPFTVAQKHIFNKTEVGRKSRRRTPRPAKRWRALQP